MKTTTYAPLTVLLETRGCCDLKSFNVPDNFHYQLHSLTKRWRVTCLTNIDTCTKSLIHTSNAVGTRIPVPSLPSLGISPFLTPVVGNNSYICYNSSISKHTMIINLNYFPNFVQQHNSKQHPPPASDNTGTSQWRLNLPGDCGRLVTQPALYRSLNEKLLSWPCAEKARFHDLRGKISDNWRSV